MNKDTTPSCGVEDYEKTWDQFYDAANLRATYSFMSSSSSSSYFSGRSGGLSEIDPGNWTSRSGYSDNTAVSSVLSNLSVDNLPGMLEFRVCEMMISLRSSLSCLFDDSLLESRVLQECIDNIEDVSNTRLDATQRIIDLELQLQDLEGKEYLI